MKKTYRKMTTRLATALLGLLLAAPGAGAQNRAAAPSPNQSPRTGKASPTVLAGATGTLAPLISNKIQFHGQVPATNINYRADPLDVCPNVVDPASHGIQSQPYQFQFESNCDGKFEGLFDECRARPNFIWTIKYFTATGAEYQEKWRDFTAGDFSKIRLYLYDRVPYTTFPLTPTNGQATQAGGNANFSAMPYPNVYCIGAPTNAAEAGDLITHARLECTGYSCGFSGLEDSDAIEIRYYGIRPAAIAVTGTQPLCRDATYPISVSPVLGATGYLWFLTGLNGAVISNVNGTSATLDVSGVPAGTNSITLRVAAQDNAHCGGIISEARELVVNLAPGPGAPANMQLSNGLCPTMGSDTKSVSVTPVSGAIRYRWTISGPGTFDDGSTTPKEESNSVVIKTPQVGQVTVTAAVKLSDCNSYGTALSRTFQIGNLEPVCTQPTIQRGRCEQNSFSLVFETNPTGLKYYFSSGSIRNVTNGATPTLTQSTAGNPVFLVNLNNGRAGSFSFDLDYFVQSNCPSGPGLISCTAFINVGKFVGGFFPCRDAPEQEASKDVPQFFPNPTSGAVEIKLDQPMHYQWLKVYNMQGSLRHEEHSKGSEGLRSFDIRSLPTGIYLVQLFDGQQMVSQRLVKE